MRNYRVPDLSQRGCVHYQKSEKSGQRDQECRWPPYGEDAKRKENENTWQCNLRS